MLRIYVYFLPVFYFSMATEASFATASTCFCFAYAQRKPIQESRACLVLCSPLTHNIYMWYLCWSKRDRLQHGIHLSKIEEAPIWAGGVFKVYNVAMMREVGNLQLWYSEVWSFAVDWVFNVALKKSLFVETLGAFYPSGSEHDVRNFLEPPHFWEGANWALTLVSGAWNRSWTRC